MKRFSVRKLCLKKALPVILSFGICLPASSMDLQACTGIYAGSGVTGNGSVYMGRSEDFGPDYAKQFLIIPAADHGPGEYLEDDYGFRAPYPSHTLRYSVIMDDPSEYSGLTKILLPKRASTKKEYPYLPRYRPTSTEKCWKQTP